MAILSSRTREREIRFWSSCHLDLPLSAPRGMLFSSMRMASTSCPSTRRRHSAPLTDYEPHSHTSFGRVAISRPAASCRTPIDCLGYLICQIAISSTCFQVLGAGAALRMIAFAGNTNTQCTRHQDLGGSVLGISTHATSRLWRVCFRQSGASPSTARQVKELVQPRISARYRLCSLLLWA